MTARAEATRAVPVMEIGGTHVTAALFRPDTQGIVERSRRRRALDASAPAATIVADLVRCGDALAAPEGATWGIALPGPFDYDQGVGRYEGVGKFDALNGFDLRAGLVTGLRARPSHIVFLNDADAFGLAEWACGAASGHRRAVAVTLGTGIGSAFLDDGRIVDEGPDVPPQGRVDLLTIGGRPLEETVSRRAVLARYAARSGRPDPRIDVADVTRLARAGDTIAADVLEEAFRALGEALRPWVERFAATVLVVGGAMAGSWEQIAPPLCAGLRGTLQVVRARHGDDAGLIGAGRHAVGYGRPS